MYLGPARNDAIREQPTSLKILANRLYVKEALGVLALNASKGRIENRCALNASKGGLKCIKGAY